MKIKLFHKQNIIVIKNIQNDQKKLTVFIKYTILSEA